VSPQDSLVRPQDQGNAAASRLLALPGRADCLFNDGDFYRALRLRVLPWLRTFPFNAIWVPASGVDAWSIAILLEEAGLYERTRIYATDDDPVRLARARNGALGFACFAASAANLCRLDSGARPLSRYFHADCVPIPALGRNIVWSEYSVSTGRTFNEFTLVVLRGPAAGAAPALRERLARLVDDSLVRFGVLAIDPASDTPAEAFLARGYRPWDRTAGFLQRTA
jgi:chemotaxis protein methyltransferase CheR